MEGLKSRSGRMKVCLEDEEENGERANALNPIQGWVVDPLWVRRPGSRYWAASTAAHATDPSRAYWWLLASGILLALRATPCRL